ncbi:MAG: serine protein kinase PrkA [Desulfobacterales bacterium]
MDSLKKAFVNLNQSMSDRDQRNAIPFIQFLNILAEKPEIVIRNIFHSFHDMVKFYVGKGEDEYPDDPESIQYVNYDCSRLFIDGVDNPFFADRLFANRLIGLVEAMRHGAQQNKIYIFEGPPGCGKSTFLNNMLRKFEEYSHSEEGIRYEIIWRIDRKMFENFNDRETSPSAAKLIQILMKAAGEDWEEQHIEKPFLQNDEEFIEIPCPSHDNPIMIIPKHFRREFFDDLFKNDEFKYILSSEKDYAWVFRETPCTICSSLYSALLERLKRPEKVFQMIYAQPYQFSRRLGQGISIFNPGDKPMRQPVFTNEILQKRINAILGDSSLVHYIYSHYAKTNNGIYALMDIKAHNTDRLIELHNIISEEVHKVEDIEENINSLFMAVMNPEDKPNLKDSQSFLDRIKFIKIPYVMDLDTEVKIYRNTFGRHIDGNFLPRVMDNFARVIISTRLKTESEALPEWIGNPEKYQLYCDKDLLLLKMEIYRGVIPTWLREEDRKRFTAKRRRKIITESEKEGSTGISGRDSIKLFDEFYSIYAKEDKLINMSMLCKFFEHFQQDKAGMIPEGFLESLVRMYDYTILQEVKESLYLYNEEQISRNIKNYLFSINFEPGATEKCNYTDEKITITEEYFRTTEEFLLEKTVGDADRLSFRKDIQKEYASKTLTQEIMIDGKEIVETSLYQKLLERYLYNLKEKVLDPFLENENFRRAIKDFDKEDFKSYDQKIREDITFLMKNLYSRYSYSKKGAQEICIYVIDHHLPEKYSTTT